MILEQIIGDVVATIIKETGEKVTLKVGDYFSDHERSTLETTGTGKLEIRVDPNCTVEIRCVEAVVEAAPVEPAPAEEAPKAAPKAAAKAAPAPEAPAAE
jgi:hypothetical protein